MDNEKYLKGIIYTIRHKEDNKLIYVGCTTESLNLRLCHHRADSLKNKSPNKNKLYKVVNGDWSNWYIDLYERFPCTNKTDLIKRKNEVYREIATIK